MVNHTLCVCVCVCVIYKKYFLYCHFTCLKWSQNEKQLNKTDNVSSNMTNEFQLQYSPTQ